MAHSDVEGSFPVVGDGGKVAHQDEFYREELQLALRNRGMPLEGMRYPVTPTGMHYLLIHFDIPEINTADWRLEVGGLVARPLSLALDEIKSLPAVTTAVTLECAGNGRALMSPRPISQPWLGEAIGTARWTGTPLRDVLESAGLEEAAVDVVFTGHDKGVQGDEVQYYQRSLKVDEALRDEVLLAYEMNDEPLQPQHGFPLRLIVPGWYGMTSVKWLDRIEAVSTPFDGFQMRSYMYRQAEDDPGESVDLIRVRAMMVPPGIPDYMTRVRLVEAGPVKLQGRAWAGRLGVSRVEVSTDGGASWADATLEESLSPYAWRGWRFDWDATPGRYTLCVRATDSAENVQPLDQPWNLQGMGNNMAQRISVIVQ